MLRHTSTIVAESGFKSELIQEGYRTISCAPVQMGYEEVAIVTTMINKPNMAVTIEYDGKCRALFYREVPFE